MPRKTIELQLIEAIGSADQKAVKSLLKRWPKGRPPSDEVFHSAYTLYAHEPKAGARIIEVIIDSKTGDKAWLGAFSDAMMKAISLGRPEWVKKYLNAGVDPMDKKDRPSLCRMFLLAARDKRKRERMENLLIRKVADNLGVSMEEARSCWALYPHKTEEEKRSAMVSAQEKAIRQLGWGTPPRFPQ